jgi:hypothetical protein
MRLGILPLFILGLFIVTTADAALIDVNDFFFYAGDPVEVAPDGSWATIGEDPYISPIFLSNDPFLGDPEVILAGLVYLIFDYDFHEGPIDNDDEFGAFIIDVDTGLSAGPDFEFFTKDTDCGTVCFDLSGLTGKTLGMQFQLSAFSGDIELDSTVKISNLHTEPIPEPSTILLILSGLGGMAAFGEMRFRRRKC